MSEVTLVFVDGFGFHYLQNKEIAEGAHSIFTDIIPLRSIIGYSAGIIPSIWTSSYPEDHGYWVRWMLKQDYLPKPIRLSRSKWVLHCLLLYSIKSLLSKFRIQTNLNPSIPGELLPLYSYKDVDVTQPFNSTNPPSFFNLLKREAIPYHYAFHQRIDEVTIPNSRFKVAILYIGEFDGAGHSYGPEADLIPKRAKLLFQLLEKVARNTHHLCVFSDHGMFPIKTRLNVLAALKSLKLTLGKDYLAFLDGTMARFWFFSRDAQDKITNCLSKLNQGHFLSEMELKSEGLCFHTNAYGDAIFLLEPTIEVYPNFFHPIHKQFFKGMHGYTSLTENSYGLLATNFNLNSQKGELLDISPSILTLLGINPPKTWKGKSLVA